MAQAAANPTTSLNRRSVVGFAAGLMLPASAGAAERHDPVFRAIARHKLAEHDLEGALDRDVDVDISRAKRTVSSASTALLSTVPTSRGGVAALLWYVRHNQEEGNSLECGSFLRAVRITANSAFEAQKAV